MPPPDKGRQQYQGCGCNPVEAACLADRAGSRRRKLLPRFVGKAGHGRIVDRLRDFEGLVAPECRHFGGLPLQVNGILCVDFKLGADASREVEKLRPDSRDIGEAYVRKGELNSAIEQFQQVLEDDPQNAAALAALGHAFYLNKDLPSAATALRHALLIRPDFPAAESELARVYAATTGANLRASAPQR